MGNSVKKTLQPVKFADTQNPFIVKYHKWSDYSNIKIYVKPNIR